MNIQSSLTLDKDVKTTIIDEQGFEEEIYLAYAAARIIRDGGQLMINFQILDKDHYEEFKEYIHLEMMDFLANVGAFTQGCTLEAFSEILPRDEKTREEAVAYLKL